MPATRQGYWQDAPEMVDAQDFRAIIGCFASGVTVVTVRGEDGEPRGFTANAFSSVSLTPPLVLVCLDHGSESYPAMQQPGVAFAVNVLARGQEDLARRFAGKGGPAKFAGVGHADGRLGVPVFEDTLAVLECTVTASFGSGDHDIVVGEVQHLDVDHDAEPLLFYRGAFGGLVQVTSEAT